MTSILIHLFGNNYPSFADLLSAHRMSYEVSQRQLRQAGIQSEIVEVVGDSATPIDLAKLAKVISEFIAYVPQRRVLLTSTQGTVHRASGLQRTELETLLRTTNSINVFDTEFAD